MREVKKKLEFLEEFIDAVELKGSMIGSREIPFFTEMLSYMNQEDEPSIIFPYIKANIKVNGYMYQEETSSLSLYVVDYDIDYDNEELPEISKTAITEIANKAKRFYTNSNGIFHSASEGVEFRELAKFINDNRKTIDEVDIYVLTTRFYLTNKPIEVRIPGVETVNVHVWDMDRIFRLSEAEQGMRDFDIEFEKDYSHSIEMMYVPNNNSEGNYDFECYIGYIPAKLLAQLYDEWGPKLVERNVRSFLQARGGTNKGIRDTLKDPIQREMFVAYNNGISSVAKDGEIEQIGDSNLYRIKRITSWQIVNGGQTTASIHQAYKSGIDLEGVYVQTKLTIIKVDSENEQDRYELEDELVSRISEYANTQNKINKSDLLANTRFMSDIENYSRNTWIPSRDNRKEENKWYFERARGQYMVDIGRRKNGKEQNDFKKVYPKENVITKVEMAKYFMSWEGYPHVSSKGGEEAFKHFMNLNGRYWKRSEDEEGNPITISNIDNDFYKTLISRRIINEFVTDVVNQMGLKGYRANVIYYTVAMLAHLYGKDINLIEVWNNQELSDKWTNVVRTIAQNTLDYLRNSAGDRNVTQWAKQEACWTGFKEESSDILSMLL
ncbi:AIPR family protein [Ureibacillus sp. GCM10028918]|uniref:AIPR family protein n=1 Tax=Ureibacillus sp. GCM10028918 TaxID=3273429 RepID=UPI003614DE33